MDVSKSLSPSRFVKATGYAMAGVRYAFAHEPSFVRIAVMEIMVAIVLLWHLWPLSGPEAAVVIVAAALILVAEIINSALEILANKVQPDRDEDIKHIKDLAAGATFIATCAASLMCLTLVLLR